MRNPSVRIRKRLTIGAGRGSPAATDGGTVNFDTARAEIALDTVFLSSRSTFSVASSSSAGGGLPHYCEKRTPAIPMAELGASFGCEGARAVLVADEGRRLDPSESVDASGATVRNSWRKISITVNLPDIRVVRPKICSFRGTVFCSQTGHVTANSTSMPTGKLCCDSKTTWLLDMVLVRPVPPATTLACSINRYSTSASMG